MAGCGSLICSPAKDRLSLGSQARLGGADSYVHVAIILRCARNGIGPGKLPGSSNINSKHLLANHLFIATSVEAYGCFEDDCSTAFRFSVSARRRGEGGNRAVKQSPQVLLVDDNPADVDLARQALAGCRHQSSISDVRDGGEAIAFLHHTGQYADAVRPDLVILDLNLPRKDGRAVLAEVKADADLHTIPIVVFSTSCAPLDIKRSYELGANCYVSKPGNLNDYFLVMQSIDEFWFGSASLPREEK